MLLRRFREPSLAHSLAMTKHHALGVAIALSATEDALLENLVRAADSVGATTASVLAFKSTKHGLAPYQLTNIPRRTQDALAYNDPSAWEELDPVMEHCRCKST